MLGTYLSTIGMVDVTRSRLESCFVFHDQPNKNVIRKFRYKLIDLINIFSSFNGATFKTEQSSKFPHFDVMAIGSYRNSPFVTGSYETNGLKTEILDYDSEKWEQLADFPFSTGDR